MRLKDGMVLGRLKVGGREVIYDFYTNACNMNDHDNLW